MTCPAGHDHDELKRNATAWAALPLVGYMPSYADPGEPPALELRNCPCRSTLCVPVNREVES